MYKDKGRQREANRQAQARFKAKGITEQGITLPEHTDLGNTLTTTQTVGVSKPKRGKDIKCFEDLSLGVQLVIDEMSLVDGKIDKTIKANRTAIAVNYQHLFPDRYHLHDAHITSSVVTGKPGDADYDGICTPEWRATRG